MSFVYLAFAFAAGAIFWHYGLKYGIRWAGKRPDAAQSILRGLSHDAFVTFYGAAVSEAKRRGVQPSAEDGGEQSREKESSA